MEPQDNPDSASTAGPSAVHIGAIDIHAILAQIETAEFDWNAYEGTYRGRALITRLNHIPNLIIGHSRPPSPQSLALARTALQRLIPLIKQTWDTGLYLRVAAMLDDTRHPDRLRTASNGAASSNPVVVPEDDVMGEGGDADLHASTAAAGPSSSSRTTFDTEWLEEAREAERKESAKLDVELRGYMSNLIKESIRLTYLASAQLALKAGRPKDALQNYTSAREYSTSPAHHVDLGVGIVESSLMYNQPDALAGHLSKLEAALDRAYPAPTSGSGGAGPSGAGASANLTAADVRENREREARSASVRRTVGIKIRVAKGLEALGKRDWERAGRELGEIGEEGGLAEWEGQAISTADTALITALCTLASAKRDRIRRVLLDRTSFRSAVDDSQSWIIDLIRAFMEAQYGEVTSILNKAEPHLLLNPFLCYHARELINLIQTRAIVQYVAPFSSIKLEVMARAFERAPADMLGQVEQLVKDGQIKGRLDLIDAVLEMKQDDTRKKLFKDAIATAKKSTTSTKAALLRMRLHEARIVVDPRPLNDGQSQKLGLGHADSMDLEGLDGTGGMGMDDVQFVR